MKLNRIIEAMEEYAPPALAEPWDNVGLLVGHDDAEVSTILVALDINEAVLDEAINCGAQLIITHHPFIFKGMTAINNRDYKGRIILRAIENGIAFYTAHTNLDKAAGGTNDTLAELLQLQTVERALLDKDGEGTGRIGTLPRPLPLKELAAKVKALLGLKSINYCGDGEKIVSKVGICTGSGADSDFISNIASAGCDVYITGDVKFHYAQDALYLGLALIDATHYGSENIILPKIKSRLHAALGNEIEIIESIVDGQVFKSL